MKQNQLYVAVAGALILMGGFFLGTKTFEAGYSAAAATLLFPAGNTTVLNPSKSLAGDITEDSAKVFVFSGSSSLSNCSGSYPQGPVDTCVMSMQLTVTNLNNHDIFISKSPAIALSTSSIPMTASSSLSSVTPNPPTIPGDSQVSYRVLANSSRTFVYSGRFGRPAGLAFEYFQISALRFGSVDVNGVANSPTVTPHTNAENVALFVGNRPSVSY